MSAVPRAEFVPAEHRHEATDDHPLPIGAGQTISQPYIVAWMTQELGVAHGMRVLEIGTGSGYQTAILLELGAEVFSLELVPELAAQALERSRGSGTHRVSTCGPDRATAAGQTPRRSTGSC